MKIRNVAMKEQKGDNRRAENFLSKSLFWPSGNGTAMEEQKCGSGRARKYQWKSKTWSCSKVLGRAELSQRKRRKLGFRQKVMWQLSQQKVTSEQTTT